MKFTTEMIKEALLATTLLGEEAINKVINHLNKQNLNICQNDFDKYIEFMVNDLLKDISLIIVRHLLMENQFEKIEQLKENYLQAIIS